jgi:hypothetical protein
MSASDRPPVGNFQIVGKPCAGKTALLTTFASEGTSMLFPARDDQATAVASYMDAFAITDEEFARIRSPKQT